ncbi:hypothetical protein BGY98DRAFT_1099976 [Russula aff. rugulosa BPL654]|nr:hypothetical protein BGY98DRAFT_1099976 [Russula aff. rugulosa BPL654]
MRNMTSSVNESAAPITSKLRFPVYRWCSPSQQSSVSTSSEGYPSWLFKRPSISSPRFSPALSKHSNDVWFGRSRRAAPRRKWKRMAGQRRQREGSTSTADARAFLRWAQTHTTSVSIVSMQDSNAATSARRPGAGGLGESSKGQIGRRRRGPLSGPLVDTGCPLACRYRDTAKVPISWLAPRTPARSVFKTRIHFYLLPIVVLALVPLQTFLDFNAVYILIERFIRRRVAKFPNPYSPESPGSGRNWVLGAVAYIVCCSVSGYSADIAVRGSMDLAHAERRKKSVGQLRCKESESGMVVAMMPAAPMYFSRAGKNVLPYAEKSTERPSKGVEGIEKAFALVGPGGAGQLQSALRGMSYCLRA